MNFNELINKRSELYKEINGVLEITRKMYEPKLAELNLQIQEAQKAGIKKRMNAVNQKKRKPQPV